MYKTTIIITALLLTLILALSIRRDNIMRDMCADHVTKTLYKC